MRMPNPVCLNRRVRHRQGSRDVSPQAWIPPKKSLLVLPIRCEPDADFRPQSFPASCPLKIIVGAFIKSNDCLKQHCWPDCPSAWRWAIRQLPSLLSSCISGLLIQARPSKRCRRRFTDTDLKRPLSAISLSDGSKENDLYQCQLNRLSFSGVKHDCKRLEFLLRPCQTRLNIPIKLHNLLPAELPLLVTSTLAVTESPAMILLL